MAMSTIVLLAGFAVAKAAENLNGDYVLSQTPGASETQQKFPVHFSDYPGKPDYFDVYSPPIKTLYSQVFWSGLPPVDLPSEVVQRFEGKGMAVVGFEVDQVRRTDQGDVAVPITVAYNHHFETTMIGKRSRFVQEELPGPNFGQRHEGHGAPLAWQPGQRLGRLFEESLAREGVVTKRALELCKSGCIDLC
ncbi:unnamed protein product [Effrenium voratum]|nr:unnamed protein product [Effrenium voratum]